MNKKIILLAFFDTIATLLFPIVFLPFTSGVFEALFARYEVYRNFTDETVALANFSELLKYITFRSGSLSEEFFSYEDILHMADVRVLFGICYVLFTLSILLFTFLKSEKWEKEKGLFYGAVASIFSAILVFFVVMIGGFDSFFTTFHKVLFRNDYWLLDPQTSNLIKFFPAEVFQILLALIGAAIIVISLVTLVISIWKKQGQVSR